MPGARRPYLCNAAALLLAAAAMFILCGPASGRPFLVENGRPNADIVIAEKPTRSAKLAARELRVHLELISGAELPVVTEPTADYPNHIYVGPSAHTGKLGLSTEGLSDGSYRIEWGENWLALVGSDRDFQFPEPIDWQEVTGLKTIAPDSWNSRRKYSETWDISDKDTTGSLYAVHGFLRSLGVEWYMPGEPGMVIPERQSIPLPEISETVKPDLSQRHIFGGRWDVPDQNVAEYVLWFFRLGCNQARPTPRHTLARVIGHPETKEKHPAYYALFGGERALGNRPTESASGVPCLSSPELLDLTIEYVRAVFDHYPQIDAFMVAPTDGYGRLCQCELCQGRGTLDRGYNGFLSDYVWGFVNQVAKEVYKTHPNKQIMAVAYSTYLLPPTKIDKLSPNITIEICRWRLNDARPGNRERHMAIRNAWLEKVGPGKIYGRDYYLINSPRRTSAGTPVIAPHLIARDLKSARGVFAGEFLEGPPARGLPLPGLNHLNLFVTARLYWDLDLDIYDLLQHYYHDFFGPAAGEMKNFVETAEKTWWSLEPEQTKELLAIIKRAQASAGDGVYAERVALIRNECEPKLKELLLQKQEKADYGRVVVAERTELTGQSLGIVVDGKLNESYWRNAPKHQLLDAVTGAKPQAPTYFQLASDGDALYLAIHCSEPKMDEIQLSGVGEDDMNVWHDDSVELILRTPENSYYQIAMNADGGWVDADRAQPGLNGIVWNSELDLGASKGDDFWTVEAHVPYRNIKGEKPTARKPWHINVGRVRRLKLQERQTSVLAPPGRRTFHDIEKMAELVIE